MLLTACVAAISKPTCPPLKAYSDAQQAKALEELERLPADSVLRIFVDDYGELRRQCRALLH